VILNVYKRYTESEQRFGFPPARTPEAEEFDQITQLIHLQAPGVFESNRLTRYYVEIIVNHTARIERILWPLESNEKKVPGRAAELRRTLSVNDSSPLRSRLRDLRNAWQHLDERMLDNQLTPRDPAKGEDEGGSSPTGWHVQSQPLTITTQGITVELEPVVDEVRVLLARCQLVARTVDPLQAGHYRM
jgi:hypothetical protein